MRATRSTWRRHSSGSAWRIRNLADELEFKFKKTFLFINKTKKPVELSKELVNHSFDKVYELGFDEEVLNLSLRGQSIFKLSRNSKMLNTIEKFRSENEFRIS